eukprot:362540-Chlamydomonas_euryale.AAC.1
MSLPSPAPQLPAPAPPPWLPGSSRGSIATAASAAPLSAPTTPSSQPTAAASWLRLTSQLACRAAHSRSMLDVRSATASARSALRAERTSMLSCTLPAITLDAPGHTRTSPTVHTSMSASVTPGSTSPRTSGGEPAGGAGPPPQRRSTVAITSAAAASESTRPRIGTVPAWPCMQVCVCVGCGSEAGGGGGGVALRARVCVPYCHAHSVIWAMGIWKIRLISHA